MNELDDRLATLRDQLRTTVASGAPPVRRAPARFPARRIAAIAAAVALVAVGAFALSRRHRGTTPPGYQGPATTVVSGLAANRKPNASYVASVGMAPTVPAGRIVLVHTPADDPEIGEIVLHVTRDGGLVVRRIVAGPGDLVAGANGRIVLNGVAVDEPYLASGLDTGDFGPVQIPAGMWWVLGDDRSIAEDSRLYGPVDTSQLRGVVTSVLSEGASDAGLPLLEPAIVPSRPDVPDVGRATACQASKTAIATAAEAYYSKMGAYPDDLRALQTAGFVSDVGGELSADGMSVSAAGPPTGDFTITYQRAADGNGYMITTSDPASC